MKEILIFAQCNLSLELIMVSIGRKKAVNKIILFPIYINSDSTSNNEGFVKKIRFHYADAEKLLSPAGISKKHEKLLPIESVPEKKRKRFLLVETRFIKNFGLPLIAIMVSKKM